MTLSTLALTFSIIPVMIAVLCVWSERNVNVVGGLKYELGCCCCCCCFEMLVFVLMMMKSKGTDAFLYVSGEGARTPKAIPYVMSMSVIQTASKNRWPGGDGQWSHQPQQTVDAHVKVSRALQETWMGVRKPGQAGPQVALIW